MTEVVFEIDTYRLAAFRGDGLTFFRTIVVVPKGGTKEPVDSVAIGFHDGSISGHGFNGGARDVYCWAPMDDFRDYFHILQTEKPLFFEYAFDELTGFLSRFELRSVAEPIGEGLQDLSP